MTEVPSSTLKVDCQARRHDVTARSSRVIPEETPIAFTYGGSTHAVMMATPADLEDFAIGFALTEGLIDSPQDAGDVEIVSSDAGIELRTWLGGGRQEAYAARKRSMAGPTGCGLCGIESLEAATRELPKLDNAMTVSAEGLVEAMARMPGLQAINRETRAVHAAAFWNPSSGALVVREDVGRRLFDAIGRRASDRHAANRARAQTHRHAGRARQREGREVGRRAAQRAEPAAARRSRDADRLAERHLLALGGANGGDRLPLPGAHLRRAFRRPFRAHGLF